MESTTKNEPKIIDVKDVPHFNEVFGQNVGEDYPFTPEGDFLRFEIPKELWYSFKLKPLSSQQKHTIEGWIREISVQGALWARKNGMNLSNFARRFATPDDLAQCKKLGLDPKESGFFDPNMEESEKNSIIAEKVAYTKYLKQLENNGRKYKLIQENILGLSKYFTVNIENEVVATRFKKEKNQQYLAEKIWNTVPGKIKESVYQDLLEKANLTLYEVASL